MLLWGWRGRTPRQPRWAMDGPSRRAPITVPQRGHRGSLGDPGRMVGQGLFGSFWVLPKGTRCKSETNISVKRECRMCTRWFCCSCLYSVHIHSMRHGVRSAAHTKPAPLPLQSGRKAAVSGQPLPLFWHCRCPHPGKPLKYGAVKTGTGFALSLSCKA